MTYNHVTVRSNYVILVLLTTPERKHALVQSRNRLIDKSICNTKYTAMIHCIFFMKYNLIFFCKLEQKPNFYNTMLL